MARSIHTTRRVLSDLELSDFSRSDERDAATARVRERLAAKRRIKAATVRERRLGTSGATAVDAIPVVVTEVGEHIHHAVSVEDVRAVLGRLPPGVLDGLTRVELQLGAEYQAESASSDDMQLDPDPFVGRLGYERFPGAWSGRVLGSYSPESAVVRLNAYVLDADAPLRDVWELVLRLEVLSTLVHEVGHHYDHTMRVARGRWLAHGKERVERYAEDRQHAWLHTAVVPYLRHAYAPEVERLEAWVAHFGGVPLMLETLADDPRATQPGGYVNVILTIWSMQEFLEGLVKDVVFGSPLHSSRVRFARDLHYREMYEEAQRCLDTVLAEDPQHPEALTLRADILVHEDHDHEALAIVRGVLVRVPDYADAWEVAADACEALRRWSEAHAAATRLIELYDGDRGRRFHALVQRAKASIRLGDLDGARADFARLDVEYPKRAAVKWVQRIRAELEDGGTDVPSGDTNMNY